MNFARKFSKILDKNLDIFYFKYFGVRGFLFLYFLGIPVWNSSSEF